MYKFFVYFRGAAMKIKITSGENYAVLGLDGAMLNSLNKNNTEYLLPIRVALLASQFSRQQQFKIF